MLPQARVLNPTSCVSLSNPHEHFSMGRLPHSHVSSCRVGVSLSPVDCTIPFLVLSKLERIESPSRKVVEGAEKLNGYFTSK